MATSSRPSRCARSRAPDRVASRTLGHRRLAVSDASRVRSTGRRSRHAVRRLRGEQNHGQPTRPQDRRPDPGDRRRDARAPDQGPAARVRHRHRRPGHRRHPAGDDLLHRPRRATTDLASTGRRARVGQGPDPLRGRQAARHAARAVAGVHPRRAARDRPPPRRGAGPGPGRPTRRSPRRRGRDVRRRGRPLQEAATRTTTWTTTLDDGPQRRRSRRDSPASPVWSSSTSPPG